MNLFGPRIAVHNKASEAVETRILVIDTESGAVRALTDDEIAALKAEGDVHGQEV